MFGMKNEGNLDRYKRALLKDGGEFFPGGIPVRGQIEPERLLMSMILQENIMTRP